MEAFTAKEYELGNTVAILSNNISAAFNTVDHHILLQKLQYYNITGNELKLLKSFLQDRNVFTHINSKRAL